MTTERPQAAVYKQDGRVQGEEEEAAWQAAVATQTISPALYGTGIVDEVSGQIGQVNAGMEVVTGVPRDDLLLGTDAFSYFTEPDRVRGRFVEAIRGSLVRDDDVVGEGKTTPSPTTSSSPRLEGRPAASCSAAIGKTRSGGVCGRGGGEYTLRLPGLSVGPQVGGTRSSPVGLLAEPPRIDPASALPEGHSPAAYSSSVTGPCQSVPPSELAAGLMAGWTIALSGAATCRCRSPGTK